MVSGTARTAVFHDNFCQYGGAERVAEELYRALAERGPVAMHTTLSSPGKLSPFLRGLGIRETWMRVLPWPGRLFRGYFLLYPFAVDGVDLAEYDLIVSSCFGYAKGVRRRASGAVHLCYCHTPMRWVWRTEDYLAREGQARLKSLALALPLRWLKRWEMRAARRPDLYIANSEVVAERLRRAFGIEAAVIPPPIETAHFAPPAGEEDRPPEDFYLVLSRLVPYKRFDLAIAACRALGRRLVIAGDGPDRARLELLAGGDPLIRFAGRVSDAERVELARRTRALLFPGEEDFGMTPLEANAAGRPVVAFAGGGALETVRDGVNGVFFAEPTAGSLASAINRLEGMGWDSHAIRRHAAAYDVAVFRERIRAFVEAACAARGIGTAGGGIGTSTGGIGTSTGLETATGGSGTATIDAEPSGLPLS